MKPKDRVTVAVIAVAIVFSAATIALFPQAFFGGHGPRHAVFWLAGGLVLLGGIERWLHRRIDRPGTGTQPAAGRRK